MSGALGVLKQTFDNKAKPPVANKAPGRIVDMQVHFDEKQPGFIDRPGRTGVREEAFQRSVVFSGVRAGESLQLDRPVSYRDRIAKTL